MSKVYKYQSYLDKYKNCPKNCKEKNLTAYRWVENNPPTLKSFIPVLIDNPGRRILDNSDLNCTGYALSLYEDIESSRSACVKVYDRMDRENKRNRFKTNNGYSAKVIITANDGVCEDANPTTRHFHFFEYESCNLLSTVSEIIDNFA